MQNYKSPVSKNTYFSQKQTSMLKRKELCTMNTIITSLAKEVMFLVALVSLFVCLSVDNITQKVMNGLG